MGVHHGDLKGLSGEHQCAGSWTPAGRIMLIFQGQMHAGCGSMPKVGSTPVQNEVSYMNIKICFIITRSSYCLSTGGGKHQPINNIVVLTAPCTYWLVLGF